MITTHTHTECIVDLLHSGANQRDRNRHESSLRPPPSTPVHIRNALWHKDSSGGVGRPNSHGTFSLWRHRFEKTQTLRASETGLRVSEQHKDPTWEQRSSATSLRRPCGSDWAARRACRPCEVAGLRQHATTVPAVRCSSCTATEPENMIG